MSESQQRYARVPAEMSRAGWSRHSDHVATAGSVTGRGSSQAKALDDLGSELTAMAARAHLAPGFGWDDANKMLWIAVPESFGDGSTHYVVRFDENGQPRVGVTTAGDSRTAREAFSRSEVIKRLANPFYPSETVCRIDGCDCHLHA